jgi:uncharacterized phage infection (PIP) family protein YhgE
MTPGLSVRRRTDATSGRAYHGRRITGFRKSIAGPVHTEEKLMNQIIYIVGAIVIVLVILGFLGLR